MLINSHFPRCFQRCLCLSPKAWRSTRCSPTFICLDSLCRHFSKAAPMLQRCFLSCVRNTQSPDTAQRAAKPACTSHQRRSEEQDAEQRESYWD